ncbi:hypothetical protein CRM22_000953 [Opisthorchis felineus]|uniref:Ion transport domain-containing protein n=1 Tax=Opisthorchis felineus TaxID=147828 RepID=A0A4S2MCS8_OPIFE|nr:hypothetical protein CRM22_000953 [Opisthorchis felineus]
MSIQNLVRRNSIASQAREEDEVYLSTRAQRFLFSSSLVRDACVSRLEIKYKRDLASLKLYENLHSKLMTGMYYLLITVNLLTILIEYPSTFMINRIHQPPYQIALTLNVVCLVFFYYRWFIIHLMSEKEKSSETMYTKVTLGILILMTLDMVIYIICQNIPNAVPVQWSRCLRPILLLTFPGNRRLRAAFNNLRRTAYDVIPVFGLSLSVVAVVSIVANAVLTGKKLVYPNNTPYFSGYLDILWEFYVLSTTANSPEVIVPAYEHDRMYITMYTIVVSLSTWLLTSILTACVYNSYKAHLGESVVSVVAKRKNKLDEAFHFVCTRTPHGELGISQGTFLRLLRLAKPGRTEDAMRVIFHLLNKSRSGFLNVSEFGRLAEYIRARFEEVELSRREFQKFVPRFYDLYYSPPFQLFKRVAEHRVTKLLFACLIIANTITAILLHPYPSLQNAAEWFFSLIFLLEQAINYILCGGIRFFKDGWNMFDFIVVFVAFVANTLHSCLEVMGIRITTGVTQVILILRTLRLLRFIRVVPTFKTIVDSIVIIIPSLCNYLLILMMFFYIYACIGMEIFAYAYEPPYPPGNYTAETSCDSHLLIQSDFVKSHYCMFNFNSAAESYLLLFTLAVGNNWHFLAHGLKLTVSSWVRVYFIVIHWSCVILVLNVILAFIIEAFLLEVDTRQTHFEAYFRQRLVELGMDANIELEKRGIYGYGTPGFHITREQLDHAFPQNAPVTKAFLPLEDHASIEVLMFRMFEREIEQLIRNLRSDTKNANQYKTRDVYSQLNEY